MENYKILYAEDDEQINTNLSEILSMMFTNVISVKNGDEAIKYYNKETPDILILDIEMPLKNGLEVAKEVRKHNKEIPIIISTAYRDTEYLLESIESNITAYILKPIQLDDLHKAIKKCKEILNTTGNEETIVINTNTYYDLKNRELYVNSRPVNLTNMEIQFLEYMIKNANRVITYDEFENYIWEDGMTSAAIRSLVRDIRNYISKESIKNIPKLGYKLVIPK